MLFIKTKTQSAIFWGDPLYQAMVSIHHHSETSHQFHEKNQTDFMNMYCNVLCTMYKTICRAFTPKVSLVRIPNPTITNKMTDNCGTPVTEPPLRKQKFYRNRITTTKTRTEYMALNLIPTNLSELKTA